MDEDRGELLYHNPEHFVLANGRPFTPQPKPKGIRTGSFQQCFDNAYRLARRRNLIYVEGYAVRMIGDWRSYEVHHAWCSTPDGLVIDNTWNEGLEYFGVPLDLEFVEHIRETSDEFSALENWKLGHPVLWSGTTGWKYTGDIEPSTHDPTDLIGWLKATTEYICAQAEANRSQKSQ